MLDYQHSYQQLTNSHQDLSGIWNLEPNHIFGEARSTPETFLSHPLVAPLVLQLKHAIGAICDFASLIGNANPLPTTVKTSKQLPMLCPG